MTQNTIQIASKTIAGIFSSKTQEHIIFASLGEEKEEACLLVKRAIGIWM